MSYVYVKLSLSGKYKQKVTRIRAGERGGESRGIYLRWIIKIYGKHKYKAQIIVLISRSLNKVINMIE